jgi:hypothetical protein
MSWPTPSLRARSQRAERHHAHHACGSRRRRTEAVNDLLGRRGARYWLAWVFDPATRIVVNNQITPIPVTLDGRLHTLTVPLNRRLHRQGEFSLQLQLGRGWVSGRDGLFRAAPLGARRGLSCQGWSMAATTAESRGEGRAQHRLSEPEGTR